MSSFVKCFDVVSMVVEEATERFSPSWRVNQKSYDILRQYCEVLDFLAKEFDGESFDVEVDEIKMTVAISMECHDMVIESQDHKYFSLAKRALSFGFSVSENGLLCMKFVFPSVWERA